jgi:Mg2+-importing ATPase
LKICRDLNLVQQTDEVSEAITGAELAKLEDTDDFHKTIKHCKVFAKLTPIQKGQVIDSLKLQGEVVGMLGDGINDAIALRKADAGISVHTATNVAKDSADILLMDKNLSIIIYCVVIGRTTQGNT